MADHKIKKKQNQEKGFKPFRSKYVAYTTQFLNQFLVWVNSFGFEKTPLGQIFKYLDKVFHIRHALFFFLFSLVISFVMFYEINLIPKIQIGDVAKFDIKSNYSFEFVDRASTEAKREEAGENVPLIFDYDAQAYEKNYEAIYKAFSIFRKRSAYISKVKSFYQREERIKDFMSERTDFEKLLGRTLPLRLFEWLTENGFSVRIENAVITHLEYWSSFKIQDKSLFLERSVSDKVILRDSRSLKENSFPKKDILDIKEDIDKFQFIKHQRTSFMKGNRRKNVLLLSKKLLIPNITFNKAETVKRKEEARKAVSDIVIPIKKNQTIVKEGSLVQPFHISIFGEIQKIRSERNFGISGIMVALLLMAFLLVVSSYIRRFTKVSFTAKDIFLMGFTTMLSLIFLKGFWIFSEQAFLDKNEFLTTEFFYYLSPLSFSPLLLGVLVLSGEMVWIFTFFISFLYSMAFDFQMNDFLYALLGGLVAVRYIYGYKKRSDIYWTGIRIGLVNVFLICIFLFWNEWDHENFWQKVLWYSGAGLGGGIFSSFVAMTLIPLMENLFNYTTDVKLLELSNLSHPLLQKLMLKAPGTYHHSLIVGSMVEAAAKRIGCNPLLAKVMAYYHDIGKSLHPEYFIENQKSQYNPHDEISPYMSRTILIAHVKDGAEMALKYNLGTPIIDGILQHHGTTTISYFYNKALTEEGDKSEIQKEDFRYPGPKPQFREAALVMLGDSIEAAARSLNEPTVSRLQSIVHNVIRDKFLDNQLDECDLTLKDLSIIEQAFERVILGVHHQRIEYPEAQ